jgi:HlyD family secretion protein
VQKAEAQLRAAEAVVEAAQGKVEEAGVARSSAQLGLDLTVVRVPNAAEDSAKAAKKKTYTVMDRKVVLGQLIAPPASAQLFTLASDLNAMQVRAQVSEDDIGKVAVGQAATFTVYAYSEEEAKFEGKIVDIHPMPSRIQGLVLYETLIDVGNEDGKLRPGMTASVNIILRTHPDAWKMPTTALDLQLDEHYQSREARAKLAKWQQRKDAEEWRVVWMIGGKQQPWPIFVRVGGKNAAGEAGISDGRFTEVLEWDPELNPRPDPQRPETIPKVITGAPPPPSSSGWFTNPKVRVF